MLDTSLLASRLPQICIYVSEGRIIISKIFLYDFVAYFFPIFREAKNFHLNKI